MTDTPEILDFKLIFYEHLEKDGIHSFDAELIEHKLEHGKDEDPINITDVKIRTLTDPKKIFDWKLGKIYMLPVNKHTKLEGVYMLLLKWKKLVHPYLKDEEANPMKLNLDKNENYKPFKTDLETAKIIEEKHTTDIIPSVSDDKPLSDLSNDELQKGSQSLIPKDKFEAMDAMDENQILDEMKGAMIEEYVYQFMQGGKLVTGIAYAGIKHITSKRGNYEDIEFNVTWNEEFKEYEAWIKIRDNTNGNTAIGLAYQSKNVYSKKLGREIPNKFAKLMAYSKARRNGLRMLMDEAPIKIFVAQWLKENKK